MGTVTFSVACFWYKYIQQQSTNNSDINYFLFFILWIRGKWSLWLVRVPFFDTLFSYLVYSRSQCPDFISFLIGIGVPMHFLIYNIFDWRFDVTICQNNQECINEFDGIFSHFLQSSDVKYLEFCVCFKIDRNLSRKPNKIHPFFLFLFFSLSLSTFWSDRQWHNS